MDDRIAPLTVAVAALEESLRRAPAATADDRAAAAAHCQALQQAVVRFGVQAGAARATGLAHAAEWLSANLEYLAQQKRGLLAEEQAQLQRWPQLVREYVAGPASLKSAAERLLQYAALPVWLLRPSAVGSANLLARLAAYQSPERVILSASTALAGDVMPREAVREPVPAAAEPAPLPVQEAADTLESVLAALVDAAGELAAAAPDDLDAARTRYGERLLAAVDKAQGAGLLGLADACGLLHESLEATRGHDATETPQWLMPALDFAALAQAFAATPGDADSAEGLLACLRHAAWPRAVGEAEVAALRTVFGLPCASTVETADAEATTAYAAIPQATIAEETISEAATAEGTPAPGDEVVVAYAAAVDAPALNLPAQQQIDPEHLALLASEFPAMLAAMRAEVDAARGDRAALDGCADIFERGASAAEAAGLVALGHVLAHVARRLHATASTLSAPQHAWLADFPQRVRAYLAAPMDPSAASALIEALLEGGDWMALAPQAATDLEQALPRVVLAATAREPQRPAEATPEQVSLAVPADINPELLDGLLSELPVQSADFAAAIQRVASGAASMFDLDVAKRAAHTLKGAANTVGVQGIANLTHYVEDILIALTKHGRMPQHELAATLASASDCLEAMSEAVLGTGPAPHDARQVLQHVLDWANRIDAEGLPADDETAAPAAAPAGAQPAAASSADAAAEVAPEASAPTAAPENTLRLPASLVDELLRLVGETMIANTQIKEQLRLTVEHTRAVTKQNTALQELAGELEQLVDVRGVTQQLGTTRQNTDFDALEFDHFNELHTVTRRLIEAATDSRELSLAGEQRLGTLAELLDGQGRLAIENQNVVMKTRLVPASTVVSRLQRSVRQTARLLDRRVELNVAGAHTAIDGQVLNGLIDPLMHLLRNAVDHGIEDPAVRAARGKPAVGRIDLSFAREGASVVVRVADDGAGLDLARIRAKAESGGHLVAGQVPGDDDIARLILLPGFSTRDDATQVSGRGIGMDAVYTKVLSLKGTLRLHNAPERGLTVELRLPASLMTTHGLLVRQNDQVLAISSYGIQDIRYVTREQVRALGSGFVVHEGGQVYEMDRLDALIGRSAHNDAREWFPALLVHTDSGALRAVRVQDVLDSQEIVVKGLGRYVPRPRGVVGVTILGDGSIAPVLDLPQLLRSPQRAARTAAANAATSGAAARSPVESRRTALVVDDSLSARRAAAQFMRDAGFTVRTAIDGMEAAALVEKQVPDIILVDMEMPRMNGLEFTTHLRTRDATRHVPIVMITSRSTEKHRRQAEHAGVNVYLTKPFADDELLEHVERLTAVAATA